MNPAQVLGGREAVLASLGDAADFLTADRGARARAALVDDAEAWAASALEADEAPPWVSCGVGVDAGRRSVSFDARRGTNALGCLSTLVEDFIISRSVCP